ncbi:hypothetical protein [Emcibacter sp.]|uniref:hypothetical protein n=1 Tax=Emcibacter sp. TaxID=1979954 RepID=UPI002AA6BD0A|nr:hypothetical protein [Emcibacter sp.]
MMRKTLLTTLFWVASLPVTSFAELSIEETPTVNKLPESYPADWVFVSDASFYSMVAGKVVLLDVGADTQQYKSSIGAALMGGFLESNNGKELYTTQTFYSRGTIGNYGAELR